MLPSMPEAGDFSRTAVAAGEPVDAIKGNRTTAARWLRYVAGLGLTILALAFTAVFYGYTRPVTSVVSSIGLARCAGVPCFRGAIPGQTSWLAALARR